MGGLLYKDFVAVKGKMMVLIWVGVIVGFTALRILFPGSSAGVDWLAKNDDGEVVNMVDAMFVILYCLILFYMVLSINQYEGSMVEGDRKNKLINYFNSMPFNKNTYYASKYIFLGIVVYVFMSAAYMLQIVCTAFCVDGLFLGYLDAAGMLILPAFSISLLFAAIELPMYIIWGKEKAMLVKDIVILVIAYFVVGYLFFGDLSWVDNINPQAIVNWIQRHQFGVTLLQVFSPVIVLGLYYLSYLLTCHLGKGEVSVNE